MDGVVHFDIPADDMKRAQKFYASLFGWEMKEMPEMSYTLVTTGKTNEKGMLQEPGMINGGMTKRSDAMQTPFITVRVKDIEAMLKKVEEAGGKVVIGINEVQGMSLKVAYVKDTEGNTLGLAQWG